MKAVVLEIRDGKAAVMTGDGEIITLQKIFHEVWKKKRGSASTELTGHTTDYFINGVPFKEKDAVNEAYRKALQEKFPSFSTRSSRSGASRGDRRAPKGPKTEKDILVEKYTKLQQDVATYENNIGFFSASKSAESMIKLMQERIDSAKKELKELEAKIREIENKEEASDE